jgi:hypothetical protein
VSWDKEMSRVVPGLKITRVIMAWILGYITAFNQYGSSKPSDVSQGTTTEEMMAFINNYRRNHPTDNLYRASAALVDQFRQKPGH